jgi:hypothetical protein
MKIISKYKDYYDYFQGIFGIDHNKIFKRKDYILKPDYVEATYTKYITHCFAINGQIKILFEDKDGIYTEEKKAEYSISLIKKTTDINIVKRSPVVYGRAHGAGIKWEDGDPILKTFELYKIMSAKDVYVEVESFMGYLKDHPEIPNNQTNMEKLESHGFDKKKSFRHRK